MKKLLFVLSLFPLISMSQFTVGFGAGYNLSGKKPLLDISTGLEIKNVRVEGQMAPSITRATDANSFFGLKIGYDIADFFTPSIGYYHNIVSTDNKELNKNYLGYSAQIVVPVNERGGIFINGMMVHKQCLVTIGAHCIL